MATHASAKKRARQNVKRNDRNRQNMSTMKTSIRKVVEAVAKKDFKTAATLFVEAQSVIAKTCKKGAIHKNNMARRIGRLASLVNREKAAAGAK